MCAICEKLPQMRWKGSDMTLRYAARYSDGSFNVSQESQDREKARNALIDSHDDDDVELVQVDITIVQSFGRPKLALVPTSETEQLRAALRAMVDRWCPPSEGSDRRMWEQAKIALGDELP
jgi:hypothetical protein